MRSMIGYNKWDGYVVFAYPDIYQCKLLIQSGLKAARKKLKLSQAALAKACNLTKNSISNYENGIYGFDFASICYIEDFFDKLGVETPFLYHVYNEYVNLMDLPIIQAYFKKRV